MAKQLENTQRAQIVALLKQGIDISEISKIYAVHRSTIIRTRQKHMISGSYKHKGCNGRPRKLSSELVSLIHSKINIDPKTSLRKLAKSLKKDHGIEISHVSIKNALNSMEKFAFSSIKKPLLSKKNIGLRFEFAKFILTTDIEDIKKIIFSDESKFELFNNNKKSFVWRKPGCGLKNEFITPTVKFGGGSVMVWGCFSYAGVGKLAFIDGIMDAAKYCSILSDNLKVSGRLLGMDTFIFQQDNDPKHTSKLAKRYFEDKKIQLLPWPAQSPDMNPIENLWAIVKAKVADLQPKNKIQLKEAIGRAWNEITPEICQKLVLSFKKRAISLYNSKGHHISK